jgi:hypothetical protein
MMCINECCYNDNVIELKNILARKFIDIHVHDMYYFRIACWKGSIKIVKYLINISEQYMGTKINIHADNDDAFRCAVGSGRLSIIKYLLKLSNKYSTRCIDLYKLNNIYYDYACYYKHRSIILLLISIGSYNNMNTHKNNKYKIIL